ncbi:hypothetical protein SAY86_023713 [Trapa natans]|uniref:non-specific serine/threonine protein kinase n=1 Tax=Trapa natans TaxID=22666 RepID=A0AAN7RBR4_TRANT|nr:hypothetical protein SAY86_023713 [Trapa natans]
MYSLPLPSAIAIFFTVIALASLAPPSAHALGSGATIAIASDTATVCSIAAELPTRNIRCFRRGESLAFDALPNVSFSVVSGGRSSICGLVEDGRRFFCWDTRINSTRSWRRVYNDTVALSTIAVGDDHVCGIIKATGGIKCWRNATTFNLPSDDDRFQSVSSGSSFSCGILANSSQVRCWGSSNQPAATAIEDGFRGFPMMSLVSGLPANSAFQYSTLSLGANHTCGIRSVNNRVVCQGSLEPYNPAAESFETVVSGSSFVCGLVTSNLLVLCWGPGWPSSGLVLPLGGPSLPGPCVQSDCSPCGTYLRDQILCFGEGHICKPCDQPIITTSSPPPPSQSPSSRSPSSPSRPLRKGLLAFAIIGSVGAVSGICSVIYCLWVGGCFGQKKVHNSVQPTITRASSDNNGSGGGVGSVPRTSPPSRSSTLRRQASRAMTMRRQRSGTSSSKHPDKAEEFSFAELALATDNFSVENKIGSGSFGVVYRGKLLDGREVAIKRGETKTKKFQEKETAFDSELVFLSRLHHKHLVRLVGYCEEHDERLLVYEYMKNGALHNHLHDHSNVEKASSLLNSWRMRIKVALDASRGIEYLHNYAVPPIIHRDIKSSNILLDSNWTARVSDFGLSLMGGGQLTDGIYGSIRPYKAVGTVGYIDPEYYGLNVLTEKSDVYGLGVVLLELLTGRRAIFKGGDNGDQPTSLVDYAVPAIMAGNVVQVLDPRVGNLELNEAEAVELVAYTAMHCVNLEGKDRPTMADIVANLERALVLCEESHMSISSCGTISVVSE